MSETIGFWTVDTAEGILKPALGVVKISIDPAPPVYDTSLATGQLSIIQTSRSFASVFLALNEAQNYRSAFGASVLFRGVLCFVADVVPDHRAARTGNAGEGIAVCEWHLVTPYTWVP